MHRAVSIAPALVLAAAAVPAQAQSFNRVATFPVYLNLPEGVEMVMPGDNANVIVSLEKPVALDIGSHFAIREGGRTVGSGVITEVVE